MCTETCCFGGVPETDPLPDVRGRRWREEVEVNVEVKVEEVSGGKEVEVSLEVKVEEGGGGSKWWME